MIVKELIKKLSKFDENLRVVTGGFDECKIDDIERVEHIKVLFHDDAMSGHCGRHEEVENKQEKAKAKDAVYIDF